MTHRLQGFAQRALPVLFVWLLFVIPFSISAIEVTFPFLLLAWLLGEKAPTGSVERRAFLALLVYVAICTLSVTYSKFPKLSLTGLIGKNYEYALMFLIAAHASKKEWVGRQGIRAIQCTAWLVVLHAFLQEWVLYRAPYKPMVPDPITGVTLDYVRMVGPYKNPNDLATYLMVSSLILVGWIIHSANRIRFHQLLLSSLLLGCLIWIHSRGALMGFAVGTVFLFYLHKDRKQVQLALGLTVLTAIGFSCFLSRSNLKQLLTLRDIGSVDRGIMWSTALSMIRAKPILGHGINTFMANYDTYVLDHRQWPAYAHNCYLQIMAETGLIGLTAFLWFLFAVGSASWRALHAGTRQPAPRQQDLQALLAGLIAGLCAFLVQSALDTNLYALRQAVLFWILSGMALGISSQLSRDAS